ncbi:heavy metal translocating P-type ATPase [Pelagibacterium limicola]|uniref:heavy metal translocating P-type ATPase n=1 Tax=Pelagibacterium limicola TaxID=2791022 RepID=UPI0018AF79B1|nr:heavy metal translocating P-type ATPase [Pelagibacterium limicola]
MTRTLQLDIPVVLPEVLDASDACVGRLFADLEGREGVEKAHVISGNDAAEAKLCIHYDPDILPLSRIREIVQAAGAAITKRFAHLLWKVDGIGHQRRARTVADGLRTLPGVLEADADAAGLVRVEFDRRQGSEQAILDALAEMGVSLEKSAAAHQKATKDARTDHDHDTHDHSHAHGGLLGPNTELIFSLVCGALLVGGFGIDKLSALAPDWLPTALYVGAYFFGGFYTLREAFDNLRMRKFEIDTLMLVAAAGAATLGAWAEGALLLFLFSLGHALEHYAMGRARQAIDALAKLAPRTATVRRDGETREVPVEDLVVGDLVVIRPNERLATDGFLVRGTSSIDQAPVTGESIPVDKRPVEDPAAARAQPNSVDADSCVFAGTINGAGAIEVEVTRLSSESALAKVVQLVSEAETQKSPTQRFTNKFERIFVPCVLALAVGLLFAPLLIDEPFADSFYRAMAVLVAASPCALAIATPSAVLSGVARAARGGVLIKGGAPLENLGSLSAIAFDKTGTLTEGRPRITDIVPAQGVSEEELLSVAVAVEQLSDHPLAAAIVRDGREKLAGRKISEAHELKSLTGRGVTAMLDATPVWIGNADMFGMHGVAPLDKSVADAVARLGEAGRTIMAVRHGGRDLGVIGLMDTPRPAARATLQRLRSLGITRMIMISGDNHTVAKAIAVDVGLDEAWGDLMPEDKVAAIRKLRNEGPVAMVGDGVNDAPAMANATVGIAMGAAGSDLALETADVALMADDLRHLPFAVGLSRHTRAIIRQNVFISLGVVALLVPATIFGLGIGPAVALHEGSTLIVVFNALRLLAWRDRD